MVEMSEEEFEELVADALDEIPEQFTAQMRNLVFLVEDEPSAEQLRDAEMSDCLACGGRLSGMDGAGASGASASEFVTETVRDATSSEEPEVPELLGLYEGAALTDGDFFGFAEPNRIFIFRGPTLRMCNTADEVAEEVMVTVFHEVAHYFGIEDDELWELGWA